MTANLETLESALLQAKTVGQLNALIIDYTHEEVIQAYNRLALEKQTQILKIWQAELQQKRSR